MKTEILSVVQSSKSQGRKLFPWSEYKWICCTMSFYIYICREPDQSMFSLKYSAYCHRKEVIRGDGTMEVQQSRSEPIACSTLDSCSVPSPLNSLPAEELAVQMWTKQHEKSGLHKRIRLRRSPFFPSLSLLFSLFISSLDRPCGRASAGSKG